MIGDIVKADTPASGPLSGLIVESIPPKWRKVVNVWVFGTAAYAGARKLRKRWEEHTQYAVTVPGDDDLYDAVQDWLIDNMPHRRRRAVRVQSKHAAGHGFAVLDSPDSSGPGSDVRQQPRAKLRVTFDGSTGQTTRIDGHTVRIRQETSGGNYTGQGSSDAYEAYYARFRKIQFLTNSTAARDAVLAMLTQLAQDRIEKPDPPRLWLASKWGHWDRREHLRPRSMDTVVLAGDMVDDLIADVGDFLASEAQYALLGLPWHRGYLFEGPPGSGKTSIAQVIATHFGLDVFVVSLADLPDDSTLIRLISEIHRRGVLILEDVDRLRIATETEPAVEGEARGATTAGLLNALDGMLTPHGLITIMTANKPDKLTPALRRSGRVDANCYIGPLEGDDLARLIRLFTGGDVPIPEGFTAIPADVVNIVKQHMHDPAAARLALTEWMAA